MRGDRLVLLPDQASVFDYFSEVQLRASSVPELVLTTQSTLLKPLLLQTVLGGAGLTLQWPSSGMLKESADLKRWIPVQSAVSPFRPVSEGMGRFYRVAERAPAP